MLRQPRCLSRATVLQASLCLAASLLSGGGGVPSLVSSLPGAAAPKGPPPGGAVAIVTRLGTARLRTASPPSVQVAPSGGLMVTTEKASVRAWDIASGSLARVFRVPDCEWAYPGRFSPDGKRLAVTSFSRGAGQTDYVVGFIDMASGRFHQLEKGPHVRWG